MLIQFLILTLGLVLLWGGAELLIRFSSALARSLGINPIIVGLTVVSIGTSLPELVVSLIAALQGTMGISIGNIIGSNIANIGLILGTGAVISRLEVKKSWVLKEVPLMIFFTLLFTAFAYTGFTIQPLEGGILLIFLSIFLYNLYHISKNQMRDFKELQEAGGTNERALDLKTKLIYLSLSFLGMIFLVVGSKATVSAGQNIARALGVSDTVIGLTLIAVGTSLPELSTTIVGVLRRETDIVVGNVLGSNIFNLLFIGGLVPIIRPIPISHQLFFVEFPILIALSFLVLPMMRFRWNLQRWEGILLLAIYVYFIGKVFGA